RERRQLSVGLLRNHRQIPQIRSEWKTALCLGNAWNGTRLILGCARILSRFGWKLVHRGSLWRPSAEVRTAARSGSVAHFPASTADSEGQRQLRKSTMSKRIVLFSVVLVVTLAAFLKGQTNPNFSGTWTLSKIEPPPTGRGIGGGGDEAFGAI